MAAQTNGWVWYPSQPQPQPQPQARSANTGLSYTGAPAPDFSDHPMGRAPARVRDSRQNPPPAVEHQAVRLPPAIPANGPVSAPPAGSSPSPTLARAKAPLASPRRRRRMMMPVHPAGLAAGPGRYHTFEFTGAAAKLAEGKSVIMGPMDFELPVQTSQTVLRTTNSTWFLLSFALIFCCLTVAFLLSSEITVGVNAAWNALSTLLVGVGA